MPLLYTRFYTHSSLLQAHILERRRPGVGVDRHQRRLLHPRSDAARPDVEPDGREHHALVHELLDLVQQGLAFRPVRLTVLLFEQCINIGIASPRIYPSTDHDFLDTRGGVAVTCAGTDTEAPQLLGGPRVRNAVALHVAHFLLTPPRR